MSEAAAFSAFLKPSAATVRLPSPRRRASSPARARPPSPMRQTPTDTVRAIGLPGRFLVGRPVNRRPFSLPTNTATKFPGPVEEDRVEGSISTLPKESRAEPKKSVLLERDLSLPLVPLEKFKVKAADPPLAEKNESSMDRLESQAKASLAKLKHLLYKLKTREDGEVKSSLIATPSVSDAPGAVVEESQVFVSQKIEVDLSTPSQTDMPGPLRQDVYGVDVLDNRSMKLLDLETLSKGLEIQLDALTCTKATVKFDDEKNTAVITVTATVRGAELADEAGYAERAIAMAARALTKTCLELDEKAQSSALARVTQASVSETALPSLSETEGTQKILRTLLTGSLVSYELAKPVFGCTPFRPVYVVELKAMDGSRVKALFKPNVGGDSHLRWKRAQEDWVAFKV